MVEVQELGLFSETHVLLGKALTEETLIVSEIKSTVNSSNESVYLTHHNSV